MDISRPNLDLDGYSDIWDPCRKPNKKIMSTLNPKHFNQIYWVPPPNNVACPNGEKNPVCLVSKHPETSLILLTSGICACLDNHIGMVSEETTYTAGLCTDTVVKRPYELCF